MLSNYYQNLSTLKPLIYEQGVIQANQQFTPFAFTDLFTSKMNESGQPIIHYWQLEHSVILGMKDSRVPHFDEALQSLVQKNYQVMLRNSGGLGIIADSGILNISFILPNPDHQSLSINSAYELVMRLIQEAFQSFNQKIEAKEIYDSYCPGDYDLSIDGKKFAGIAQRRIKEGISVMIYLSVNGPQIKRGQVMRQFYQLGLAEHFGENGYPPVSTNSMANLEDLLNTSLSVNEVKELITASFQNLFTKKLVPITEQEIIGNSEVAAAFARQIERMSDRNELITNLLGGTNENTL